VIRVSVSSLDLYRKFISDDEYPLGVFLADLRGENVATPAMMRGRAFAVAMEHASLGETSTISAEGHTFAFTCDAEIESWPRREEKREKDYGGVIVSARCDRIMGRTVADDKTTSQFDAESYMDKYQPRFYMSMFDADVFQHHVWECREIKSDGPGIAWEVYAFHKLTTYRYPEMEEDCAQLVRDFANFAAQIGWTGRQNRSRADVGEAIL